MMAISKTKRNSIGFLTLFTVIIGLLGALVLHKVSLGNYFEIYPLIPVYFYLFGLFSIYSSGFYCRFAPQRRMLIYLAVKMMKMIISLILLVVYCLVAKENIQAFLLTFVIFYLLFLIYETCFFSFDKDLKQTMKNENQKNNETVA